MILPWGHNALNIFLFLYLPPSLIFPFIFYQLHLFLFISTFDGDLFNPPYVHKMDPNKDANTEEQQAPFGEPDDPTENPQSFEVNPSQPVLFCDVHLSQQDVHNWSKKDAFRHFYVNWYLSSFPFKYAIKY